jgi:hypothetical protein
MCSIFPLLETGMQLWACSRPTLPTRQGGARWKGVRGSHASEASAQPLTAVFLLVQANIRKTQLCDPHFHLACVMWLPDSGVGPVVVQELNFELNQMAGRCRGINFSQPMLGLPWTVRVTCSMSLGESH